MYLKEIEIQGFKSFADKTRIIFDQGVTAVVGPNGSGKSNITESLRWALGESSVKSLRGGKMPDVIFAGTETRKALNFASVMVLLDNSDGFIKEAGSEIRVERQIYRTGDSEYKIDGRKVRLRDVHNLFLDTGLGRDSFSIISQGRVEEIFNSKPDERRAIFEEAAGVLKYKSRRKETESKLSQTQDNLDRLEDIIYELETQIKPLEKQSQTAKEFLKIDNKRKSLQLNVLVAKILRDKESLEKAKEELSKLQEELKDYYQKRDLLERDHVRIKKERQQAQSQQEDYQQKLLHLTSLISDLERRLDRKELEQSQAESSRKERLEQLSILKKRRLRISKQLEEKETSIQTLSHDVNLQKQETESLEKQLATYSSSPDQMIEHLRETYIHLVQEEAELTNQVTSLQNQIDRYLEELETQKADVANLQVHLKDAQEKERIAQEELDVVEVQLQNLLAAYQSQVSQVGTLRENYQTEQAQMFDIIDELKRKQARVDSLENIQKSHSNLYSGARSVLQQAETIRGIIGVVSEHLNFDRRYQIALEVALGASSQYIIVEDEHAATRAIEHLKKSRAGRATFLPLTTIKPRKLADHYQTSIENAKGYLGLASQLVSFENELTVIFENLLGSTAVFDTIENARQAAKSVRYQVRIVTLDGTELRTGGSYAGGSNRNQNSTFIKPELDSLKEDIATINQELRVKESVVEKLQVKLYHADQRLEEIRNQGEEIRLAEQKTRLSYEQACKETEELRELQKIQLMNSEEGELETLQERKVNHEKRLQKIDSEKESLQGQIEQLRSSKDQVESKVALLREQVSESRLSQAELANQLQFSQMEYKRLDIEAKEVKEQIESLEKLLKPEVESEKLNMDQLKQQILEAQEEKEKLSQSIIRLRFELEDLEGQGEDLETQLERIRHQNEDYIRQQTRQEAVRDRLIEHLRQMQNRLSEEYRMSFDEARQEAEAIENLSLAEQEVKNLERSIQQLGPINLDSIAQYDEVKGRLDFLNSQREDILSAKELLLSTISEMNDEVKARFKVSFDAIRESFKETFRQMFGGGQADLLLTDGDLLTAGIEISVQPPGKKIQSLNLMSGGEKALSALALLFSIIRVKTIPFVILDEVEAALDEANVKRFGDYLNRFDKSSQFIVVTHRKGTMVAADSIYGVTMQESGVSKLVSVKLTDIESI
ncbi:Chromosome partition protein smc [Streptococcus sp. DD10]|uniref:chromosome segregation protein SMC n=1 Tax=Streptococcus sp. DD10 TaxID=1777878 RepID=UPI000792F215|nr:chromosome segregation protein SMC [Streptococcus sp. DD10]KXT77145.1 Chromosome partition protein smc [Streptococcus sp. DD10]